MKLLSAIWRGLRSLFATPSNVCDFCEARYHGPLPICDKCLEELP